MPCVIIYQTEKRKVSTFPSICIIITNITTVTTKLPTLYLQFKFYTEEHRRTPTATNHPTIPERSTAT